MANFDEEFDALLSKADPAYMHDVLWARDHQESLDAATLLLEQVIGARKEFQLVAQPPKSVRERSYLLKTASNKEVAIINCRVENSQVFLWPTAAPHGLKVADNPPPQQITAANISAATVRTALTNLAQEIERKPK